MTASSFSLKLSGSVMPPDGFSRKLNTPSSLPSGGVTVMVNFTCTALPLAVTSVLSGVMVSVAVSSAHAVATVPSSSITLRMAQTSLRTHIPLSFSHHIPLRRLCQPQLPQMRQQRRKMYR